MATTSVLSVNPYLRVKDASKAIEWYKNVFGASEQLRLEEPSGRVGHAELKLGDVCLMLSDEYPEHDMLGPVKGSTGMMTQIMVKDNCDDVFNKAVKNGATKEQEPKDWFYGHRSARFVDPFGHTWAVSHEIKKLSNEEIKEKWTKMFEKTGNKECE